MSQDDELCVVVTTCASQEEALSLARGLLAARLIACAQTNEIRSLYVWGGEMRDDVEWRLACKTLRSAWPRVEAEILAAHSYETPEILRFDVAAAPAAYRNWAASLIEPL